MASNTRFPTRVLLYIAGTVGLLRPGLEVPRIAGVLTQVCSDHRGGLRLGRAAVAGSEPVGLQG